MTTDAKRTPQEQREHLAWIYNEMYPPHEDTPAKREKFARLIKRGYGKDVVFDGTWWGLA